ncbi:MAG: S-adenosylmethionine decarboxylase [Candidatus Vogelbacteria bacterium]|nr:S-adenosylmethionine decarboxylase [Candidatus Vogelbacteria bacterium]
MKKLEQEYLKKKSWGMVASIDVHKCDHQKITTKKEIQKFVIELCDSIGMKRHGPTLIERFAEGELAGHSAMQFIETSSITMHFDDQHDDRAFIDIFSCKYFDYKKAELFCRNFLGGKKSKAVYYFRH